MTDLLASIVASRHLAPEPVATDALVHLCQRASAHSTITQLLLDLCPTTSTSGLSIVGQEICAETEGRPDLVANDQEGTRLVVEAKFDAELTPAQLEGHYLTKLSATAPSALVFLVPQDRVRSTWVLVANQLGNLLHAPDLSSSEIAPGIFSMGAKTTPHVLAVLSWDSLLSRLRSTAEHKNDVLSLGEIAAIEGLARWRARTGWSPLLPGDLSQRSARQLQALVRLNKEVTKAVSSGPTRNGTADGGPGRHIRTPTGRSIWVGIWFKWWDERGPGPLWAHVQVKTGNETATLSQALTIAGIDHDARPEFTDVRIPLPLRYGVERTVAFDHLQHLLSELVTVVDQPSIEVISEDSTEIADPSLD